MTRKDVKGDQPSGGETTWTNTGATLYMRGQHKTGSFGDDMLRPSPNHGTQRLPNDDDDDDVLSLLATCEDIGNPFLEDNGDMLTLDTKVVMNKDAIRTVNAVEEIGQRQFSECVEDRLNIASNKPLSHIVSKNKLALFSTPQTKQRSRSKEQVASLKTNCTLFSRLYIACQPRQSNLDSIFEQENQACPPSISDMGQLRHGSKSDLMECLTKSSQPESIHPGIYAKV